jgi:hypothetical protein
MSGHLQGPPQETAPDRPVLHSSAGMGHGRSGRADRRVCARSQSPSPCRRLAIAFQPDQWLASLHEYASPPCAEIVRYCRRASADGVETHCRPDCRIGVPRESGAPAAAVDLPCPVGSLDGVECDQARSDRRVAALAAGLPPAPGRDPGHAAVPGEPGGSRDRGRLASPADTRDSANADPLAQADLAVAAVAGACTASKLIA